MLAWALATLASLAGIAGGALVLGMAEPVPWKPLLLPALWAVPGAMVAAARPRIAVGWLMLAVALVFAGSGVAEAWVRAAATPGTALAVWVVDRGSALLVPCTLLALVLLPDGRLPHPAWRWPLTALVAAQGALIAAWALARGTAAAPDSDWPPGAAQLPNPLGVLPGGWGDAAAGLDWAVQLPLLVCLVAVGVRLRRADTDERRRTVLVLLGLGVFVVAVVSGRALWAPVADLVDVAASVFLAVVLVTAVLRRHLEGVALVVRHSVVYAVLVLLVATAYVVTIGVLTTVTPEVPAFGAGVVAAVLALAVHPLRHRLHRVVHRLLRGDVGDPYGAVNRLVERAHGAPGLDEVLTAVAGSVASSLRVPWVQVEADGVTVERGNRPVGGSVTATALRAGETTWGRIEVGCGPGRRLGGDELRLLDDLGRHAGVAVAAVRLSERAAEHSRDLVIAREEERRRLGRELHDELGPTVAGLSMQLGALQGVVRTDPDAAVARLANLERSAASALVDIRRVAHDLRPPVLDQVGLVAALQHLGESLGLAVGWTATWAGPCRRRSSSRRTASAPRRSPTWSATRA